MMGSEGCSVISPGGEKGTTSAGKLPLVCGMGWPGLSTCPDSVDDGGRRRERGLGLSATDSNGGGRGANVAARRSNPAHVQPPCIRPAPLDQRGPRRTPCEVGQTAR